MSFHTLDTFFDGRIRVRQSRSGYRFSVDAVLLAHQVSPKPGQSILDLGTGCGIIPLILAHRHADISVQGVEVQEDLARLAEGNVVDNRLEDRVRVFHMDLNDLPDPRVASPVDWVVSNPPFRGAETGRVNPDRQRAVARHEIRATLKQVVAAARRTLRTAGRFAAVFPAERLTDLLLEMRAGGIEPKRLRFVQSRREGPVKRVLVEGGKGARAGILIDPPVVLYREDGSYDVAAAAMFRP